MTPQTPYASAFVASDDPRARVMNGMMAAVADKGYYDTTIADIVALARVSKRTFYECFDNKEACFVACFEHLGKSLIEVIIATGMLASTDSWQSRLGVVIKAIVDYIGAHRRVVSPLLMQIHAIGPVGMRARREGFDLLINLLVQAANEFRSQLPGSPPLSRDTAVAIVGGLNELLLEVVERGEETTAEQMVEAMSAFLFRALSLPACEAPRVAVSVD